MNIPEFYRGYINLYDGNSISSELMMQGDLAIEFYRSIGSQYQDYRYAEGKWSIREVLAHVIDAERIFAYRALRLARNDQTPLPGFDENAYVPEMNIEKRQYPDLINEFANVRASNVDLFSSFSQNMLERSGKVSDSEFTVDLLGKVTVGHEIHHRNIIESRYLQG